MILDSSASSFNPRPSLLTGELVMQRMMAVLTWFQSAPVIADGRAGIYRDRPAGARSFNPRPSLLTGELAARKRFGGGARFQSAPVIADGRAP